MAGMAGRGAWASVGELGGTLGPFASSTSRLSCSLLTGTLGWYDWPVHQLRLKYEGGSTATLLGVTASGKSDWALYHFHVGYTHTISPDHQLGLIVHYTRIPTEGKRTHLVNPSLVYLGKWNSIRSAIRMDGLLPFSLNDADLQLPLSGSLESVYAINEKLSSGLNLTISNGVDLQTSLVIQWEASQVFSRLMLNDVGSFSFYFGYQFEGIQILSGFNLGSSVIPTYEIGLSYVWKR